jgi:hypothetical protein
MPKVGIYYSSFRGVWVITSSKKRMKDLERWAALSHYSSILAEIEDERSKRTSAQRGEVARAMASVTRAFGK